jgi:hypothetical protein
VLLLIPLTFGAVIVDTKLLSDHAAYGKINIDDRNASKILRLPNREIEVSWGEYGDSFNGRLPGLSLPAGMSLTVVPVDGRGPAAEIIPVQLSNTNSDNAYGQNDSRINVAMVVWKVKILRATDYSVTFHSSDSPRAELILGHGRPVPFGLVWAFGGAVLLTVMGVGNLMAWRKESPTTE